MASKKDPPLFDHSGSYGATWADQWDYKGDVSDKQDPSHNMKTSEKIKSAANTGFVKAKIAATVGARKIKEGSSTGVRWIKMQYQKRSKK